MNQQLLLAALTAVILAASAPQVQAQDVTADVRTWGGQSWRLSQPSLEVFYTIVPPTKESEGNAAGAAAATGVAGGVMPRLQVSGSAQAISSMFAGGPEPIQGRARAESLTLHRGGIQTQVSFASIASLALFRQPIAQSQLPPYIAPTHFRYSAVAVLNDGSRVEGDYVNLGTTVLRGMTPQGRVDIPWEDVETIRFQR